MKVVLLLVLSLASSIASPQEKCIEKRSEISFQDVHNLKGLEYIRFSPDGNYAIATVDEQSPPGSVIIDFTHTNESGEVSPQMIRTNLSIEAYALEPDWEYVLSPFDDGSTKIYKFSDLLQLKKEAKPVFKDKEFLEFYSSAARVEGRGDEFRVAGWSMLKSRTYSSANNVIKPTSVVMPMCPNFFKFTKSQKKQYSECSLMLEIGIDKLTNDADNRYFKDTESMISSEGYRKWVKNGCGLDSGSMPMSCVRFLALESLQGSNKIKAAKYSCDDFLGNVLNKVEMNQIENPILSKDGKEFAIISDENSDKMSIYKIDDKTNVCTKVDETQFRGSKVNFDYKRGDKKGRVAFKAESADAEDLLANHGSQVHKIVVYDRDNEKSYRITQPDTDWSPSYPGFLKDGRLRYYTHSLDGVTQNLIYNFVTVDPNQYIEGANCITTKKVSINSDSSSGKNSN